LNQEKPIISPSRTDAKYIISPGIYQCGQCTVRCFVVYPTQTKCFHSVPLVRRLVAATGARSKKALATSSPTHRP